MNQLLVPEGSYSLHFDFCDPGAPYNLQEATYSERFSRPRPEFQFHRAMSLGEGTPSFVAASFAIKFRGTCVVQVTRALNKMRRVQNLRTRFKIVEDGRHGNEPSD